MNIIETRQLGFAYENDPPVLENVDFTVLKGDFAALVGSNGAGKSTFIKLLLGELTATAGEIRLLGSEIHKFKEWPKIGYVPQNGLAAHGSFPASVEEIVRANLYSEIGMFRFPGKKHHDMVRGALSLVGMEAYEKRLIGNMSGGQQQRVLLARALVNSPELMLLDEPTTGVDDKSAESFYRLLEKLNKDTGLTILMVTHDIYRLDGLVSNIYRLENGGMSSGDI